jgi:hypothetical protein
VSTNLNKTLQYRFSWKYVLLFTNCYMRSTWHGKTTTHFPCKFLANAPGTKIHGGPKNVFVAHVDGVRWCPWTAATNRPIVHPPDEIWAWRAMVEWYWQGKIEDREKFAPVPFFPLQISLGLTRAPVVRGRRLTAWAMVRAKVFLFSNLTNEWL